MSFYLWRLFFPIPDPPPQPEIQPTYKHMRHRNLLMIQIKNSFCSACLDALTRSVDLLASPHKHIKLRRTFIVAQYGNTTYREPQLTMPNALYRSASAPPGDFAFWSDQLIN